MVLISIPFHLFLNLLPHPLSFFFHSKVICLTTKSVLKVWVPTPLSLFQMCENPCQQINGMIAKCFYLLDILIIGSEGIALFCMQWQIVFDFFRIVFCVLRKIELTDILNNNKKSK